MGKKRAKRRNRLLTCPNCGYPLTDDAPAPPRASVATRARRALPAAVAAVGGAAAVVGAAATAAATITGLRKRG